MNTKPDEKGEFVTIIYFAGYLYFYLSTKLQYFLHHCRSLYCNEIRNLENDVDVTNCW